MTLNPLSIIAFTISLAVAALHAAAKDVTMHFGQPLNTQPASVAVVVGAIGAPPIYVPAVIPPGASPAVKAFIIGSALVARGFQVDILPLGLPAVTIKNLRPAVRARFIDYGTGERPDQIRFAPPPPPALEPGLSYGTMDYGIGHFDPFDPQNQPAIFTAGIITDVGEISVQVTAAELNFQTDGPIICQALFQRLAPQAPQYGAQINYAGDRLEVYFDPAYTVTQGGIIFGNTSRQGESGASIDVPLDANPPPVEFKFSLPITPTPAQLMFNLTASGNPPSNIPVQINPGDSVLAKRDKVVAALVGAGAPASPSAPDKCVVGDLAPNSIVRMTDMGSCEANDSIRCPGITNGMAGFPGLYQPMAPNNQPAIFRAGIITDVGVLSEQVSAQELNFQTDGPIICQALFQRLAPRAPQYGAQINYAGDRLEVYFDPAYTVTQGGIIFGTNSPTPGNFGQIILPPAPPVVLGDMNCDGDVNSLDIQPFIEALTSPDDYQNHYPGCNILGGDFDGDGAVTMLDMDPFLNRLAGN